MKRALVVGLLALALLPASASAMKMPVPAAKQKIRQKFSRNHITLCERFARNHVYCRGFILVGDSTGDSYRERYTYDVWPHRVWMHTCVTQDCPYPSAAKNPS